MEMGLFAPLSKPLPEGTSRARFASAIWFLYLRAARGKGFRDGDRAVRPLSKPLPEGASRAGRSRASALTHDDFLSCVLSCRVRCFDGGL